ncbi:transmembrane protein 63B-like [Hibiscus syriacus]|uniref:Transmembrane protein 63B-like n=1 Tax=Hibiscus syriacus TaxID=106335 RepID=A0A6A2ZUL2_HIBSY|nr:uncharacterized protein LOC120139300 [Hibiscus syriacus]KAE8695117.1 transmembrane protein 63B-like [Hibiscus syriacus]
MKQHLPVKCKLVDSDSDTTKLGFGSYEQQQPLCPKPRRVGPPIPEFLKPLKCTKHSLQNTDVRSGVLNMIDDKKNDGACAGCWPSCYAGSPPGRTGNPLVHDVHFVHQMELLSPFTRTNLSDKFGIHSASPA